MGAFERSHRYEPRAVRSAGVQASGGWRLKRYEIVLGDEPLDREVFAGADDLVFGTLPVPGETARRPGVGFVILHQGRGASYVVLGWWDNENELPLRVWVRDEGGAGWREAAGHESVCVWDLRVLHHERESYVRHVLGAASPDVEAYAADVMDDGPQSGR